MLLGKSAAASLIADAESGYGMCRVIDRQLESQLRTIGIVAVS